MGFVLGSIENKYADVASILVLERKDKRKDRVEISADEMAKASQIAEEMKLRIIGWYHSHPHITVPPSPLDVFYQYQYNLHFDKGFFGLILSVFSTDKDMRGEIKLIGFQSVRTDSVLVHRSKRQRSDHEIDQSDDMIIDPSTSINGPNELLAAVHIPIDIVDTVKNFKNSQLNCLEQMVKLQQILAIEEKQTYKMSLASRGDHPIAGIHDAAVYTQSLTRLLEYSCIPLLHNFMEKKRKIKEKIEQLREEREKLLKSKKDNEK